MLYLDEVTLHNFKSFKNATIKFKKGFNCIAGPNTSGKSNVCDAMLFALGEMSFKRLRINSVGQLISYSAKPSKEDKLKRAYVRIKFSGDTEVEVVRIVRSDRKVKYKLNGKGATRQDVIEVLRQHHADINETNTITQDEIIDKRKLNAKGRRELIDLAAGISEFNEKRDKAQSNLDGVTTKVSEAKIQLSERLGFLKDLEKEKIDAEKHLELTAKLKASQYTLLKLREKEAQDQLGKMDATHTKKEAERHELEKRVAELSSKISTLAAEKERQSVILNEKSKEAGSTNTLMSEITKKIAVNNAQAEVRASNVKEEMQKRDEQKKELERNHEKIKSNEIRLKKFKFELEVKQKNLPEPQDEDGVQGNRTVAEKFKDNSERSDEMQAKIMSLSSEEMVAQGTLHDAERELSEMKKTLNELGSKRETVTESIKSNTESITDFEKSKHDLEIELSKEQKKQQQLTGRIEEIDTSNIEIREHLAQMGALEQNKADELLKKSLKAGFYGRIQNLCTYDPKYGAAVQAAAGARLNYFVVDSIDIASEGVKLLRQNKAGRASFLPLREVSARATKKSQGANAKPLIDLVAFDKKYTKAFEYVFSNTYLVGGINEAQKLGIGEMRYVTLDGDLLEPSGIVTGGSIKVQQSRPLLETRLKELENEKKDARKQVMEIEATLALLRKKIVGAEASLEARRIEVKRALEDENSLNRDMEALEQRVKGTNKQRDVANEELEAIKTEKKKAEAEAVKLKDEGTRFASTLQSALSGGKKPLSKEEREKLKVARDEIVMLQQNIAALSKENEIQTQICADLEKETVKAADRAKAIEAEISRLTTDTTKLDKERSELQERLETHDKKTAKLVAEIKEIEASVSKLSTENGELKSKMDRLAADLVDIEAKRSYHQTRMEDTKAELMSYQGAEEIRGAKADELEKDIVIFKNDVGRLGAVNLKAPEMYAVRKKDVQDAEEKLGVLESEKTAVISMIEEIESRKMSVFMDTFSVVNQNFQKMYKYVFDGVAELELDDIKNPFGAGLSFSIETAGHRKTVYESLSGGHKSLIMLMLVFAIQSRKHMSFYLFDEIDEGLDKSNSKILSKLMKELSTKSQFIVVSHNDALIASADAAIGVTKRNDESQIIGIQIGSNKE